MNRAAKEPIPFEIPKEDWVLAPFVEPPKGTDYVYFTEGVIFKTSEKEEKILVLKNHIEPKVIGLQAFFMVRELQVAGYKPTLDIVPAPFNTFKCGWRSDKPDDILNFKTLFLSFLKDKGL